MSPLDDRIAAWAAGRHLAPPCIERWLRLKQDDRAALLKLAEELRLRTGQFEAAFDLIEEIALRERSGAAEILARDACRRAARAAGSTPARGRALLEALRAARFPRLSAAKARLHAKAAALSLPPAIKIVLPKDLSSDELTVELRARSGAELKKTIEALSSRAAGLAEIAEALSGGGDDEINEI